ncbi:MAG: MobA/MobL family protein [Treponema sp.]|nr:MobA/MobL family protein [Treponema sp.]
MAIYHLHAKIIGRAHGRTATSASAYASGGVLGVRSIVGSAAYRSGDILGDQRHNLTRDFTSKSGVVYTNILLPDNAPVEFKDRETLWNAVEQKEVRRDAQLAREVEVSIPREFDFDEQINVVENFVQNNFTNRGMCADFSIHDKRDGNPHAHILLTVRDVGENGFENKVKSREWNKVSALREWRENWADVCNEKLTEKGVEKIDHRSFEEQGIDRTPTAHMGHEAHALEKQGTKTLVGNMNREIIKSNLNKIKHEYIGISREIEDANDAQNAYSLRQRKQAVKFEYQKLKSTAEQYYFFDDGELANLSHTPDSEHLNSAGQQKKLIPALAHEHNRVPTAPDEARATESTAQHILKIKERVILLDSEISALSAEKSSAEHSARTAEHHAEKIAERADHIRVLDNRVAKLKAQRQNMRFEANTKEIDRQISQNERAKTQAENMFVREYKIAPEQASTEINRLVNQARDFEISRAELDEKILPLIQERDNFELEYKRQNILLNTRPDEAKIRDKLSELEKETRANHSSAHDITARDEAERRLNKINEHDFNKILLEMHPKHHDFLIRQRDYMRLQQRDRTRDFIR